jgi:indolepyruvate ferredoxin oxidoreductase beta subunit
MFKADHDFAQRPGSRILIAGTGGQGVVTAARLLAEFMADQGHRVVSSQLHGMAQRGGAVQSAVMIDRGIAPALGRGSADFVLGLEPVETARALPFMSAETLVLMNTVPVLPFVLALNTVHGEGLADYPPLEKVSGWIGEVTGKLVTVDATALATEAGSVRSLNVVMLGILFGSGLLPHSAERFLDSLMNSVPPRLAETNRKAFLGGAALGGGLGPIEEKRCL